MATQWLTLGTLAIVLLVALGHDLTKRRIPNWLISSALVAAFFLNVLSTGTTDVPFGFMVPLGKLLLGLLTGFVAMLPMYMLRAMGAGDVKLMATVGAFLGPAPTLGALLLVFMAGGVLSLAMALYSGTFRLVVDNLRRMVINALPNSSCRERSVQTTGRVPYALAIAIGTAIQLWAATQAGWPFK